MKILAIRGANLASLEGEFAVELAHGPIAAHGLFAIVGDTGAGKSTILDALCVALYDKTPRLRGHSKVQIGVDENALLGASDVRGLLRRGASSGYAEVEFVGVTGDVYRARWSVHRAKRGASKRALMNVASAEPLSCSDGSHSAGKHAMPSRRIQDQQMTLVHLQSGRQLGGTRRETLAAIESAIGLSFEQFCRAALLAQGDFAAFLRADAGARAELLEAMTGTELYSELSRRAYQRAADVKQELALLEARDAAIVPLGEVARATAVAQVVTASETLARAEAHHRELAAQKELQQRHRESEALLAAAQAELAAAHAKAEQLAGLREDVQTLAALEPLRAPAVSHATAHEAHKASELRAADALAATATTAARVRDMQATRDQWHELATRAAAAADGVTWTTPPGAVTSASIDCAAAMNAMQARSEARAWGLVWPQVKELAGRAEPHDAAATQARAKIQAETTRRAESTAQAAVAHTDEAQARQQLTEAQRAAEAFALPLLHQSLAEARQAWQRATQAVADAKQLQELIESAKVQAALVVEHNKQRMFAEHALGDAESAHQQATRVQHELAVRLSESSSVLNRLLAAAGLAEHRARLVPGEPCALCGATEHPWQADGVVGQMLADAEARVATLRHEEAAAAAKVRAAMRAMDHAEAQRTSAAHYEAQAAEQGAALQTRFSKLIARAGELVLEHDPTSEAAHAFAKGWLARRTAAVRDAEAHVAQLETQWRAAHDALAAVNTCAAAVDAAAARTQAATALVTNAERVLADANAGLAMATSHLADIQREHAQLLARAGLEAHAIAPSEATVVEWRTAAGRVAHWALVARDKTSQLAITLAQAEAAAEAALAQLTFAQTAATDAATRWHDLDAAWQRELTTRNLDANDVRAYLARPTAWQQEAQHAVAAVDEAVRHASAVVAERRARCQALPPATLDDASLATAIIAATSAVAAANEALLSAREQVRIDDDARTQRDANSTALAQKRAGAADVLALADLIGSADGKAFRTFAQSLSLEALLDAANLHLREFAPRYRLGRVPGSDLELQVIDRDFGDDVRSLASLSGGETFLVSLALALALSATRAKQVPIGTLFIDEGFGTLDPAALDAALAVLDRLHHSGRQVGIISHVPGLVERVGACVEVRREGDGKSSVHVRAAG